jgi:ketosteroid isomerase-like protein
VSEEALRVAEEVQAVLPSENVVAGLATPEVDRRVRAILAKFADPDFEVRMIAPERVGGGELVGNGIGGFTRLWEEWTEPFESFRIEMEQMLDAGDCAVTLVRISGRTKTGGVEIEQRAAGLWRVRDGRLEEVSFYLDPDAALKAAGLDPDRP